MNAHTAVLPTAGLNRQPSHYPNLDGLRCIAALCVIATHSEQQRSLLGLPSSYSLPAVANLGQNGVMLFFVLSGFLISTLLLQEKRRYGAVNVRAFYLRRILRIWPVYYLALVLGFGILPHFNNQAGSESLNQALQGHGVIALLLYIAFAANVAFVIFPSVPFLGVLWSIGTEEQFYLVWPWVVRLGRRRFMEIIIGIPILCVATRVVLVAAAAASASGSSVGGLADARNLATNYFLVDCMAFGALVALLVKEWPSSMRPIFTVRVQVACLLALLLCIACGYHSPLFGPEIYGVLFAIVIVNAATNPQTIFRLEVGWLRYLGRISYGIYVYQFIGIDIAHEMADHIWLMTTPVVGNILTWGCACAFTVLFATASYYWLELRFLKLKRGASPTGTNAERQSNNQSPDTQGYTPT